MAVDVTVGSLAGVAVDVTVEPVAGVAVGRTVGAKVGVGAGKPVAVGVGVIVRTRLGVSVWLSGCVAQARPTKPITINNIPTKDKLCTECVNVCIRQSYLPRNHLNRPMNFPTAIVSHHTPPQTVPFRS